MQIIKFSFCFPFHRPRFTLLRMAVVVRLGSNSLHTVIIAMTSCNDVIAIFLFGVLCGVVFSTGNLTHQLLQGPVGIVMGCVFGAISGLLVLLLPAREAVRSSWRFKMQRKCFYQISLVTTEMFSISASIFRRFATLSQFLSFFIFLAARNILMDSVSRQSFSAGRSRWWGASTLNFRQLARWAASPLLSWLERDGEDRRQRMRRLAVTLRCTWISYGAFWSPCRSV